MYNQKFIQNVFCQVLCCPVWAAMNDCAACELPRELKSSPHSTFGSASIQLEDTALSSHMVVLYVSSPRGLISLEGVLSLIPLKIPNR